MVATIEAFNLTKVYSMGNEQVYGLNNFTLKVEPGELAAVIGRPGSGKSTLLHILGCLQRTDGGELRIDGVDVSNFEDAELARVRSNKIGFLFQAFNLLPNETVVANVEVPLRHQGMGAWDRQQKAAEALEVVGLEHRLQHKPGQLSATQRQCVAIARALVHNPAVILADEPTKVLDSTSREEVMGLFQKLNDAGMTIIIATPDSGIAGYCTKSLRITDGKSADYSTVSKRRIIPPERIPGTAPPSYVR